MNDVWGAVAEVAGILIGFNVLVVGAVVRNVQRAERIAARQLAAATAAMEAMTRAAAGEPGRPDMWDPWQSDEILAAEKAEQGQR